jgi:hypothetical protein
MLKPTKSLKVSALILLASILFLGAISPNLLTVKAQTTATITVDTAIGGTTDLEPNANVGPGTYTYADGTSVSLTATANAGYNFDEWTITSSLGTYADTDNPATLVVNATIGTYTVDALFVQLLTPPSVPPAINLQTAAIVVVLPGSGGTTSPPAGTYALSNALSFDITATPASGFTFSHWVIAGTPLSHGAYAFTATPTNNPYNVNHGYGDTYYYQPVFSPVSTTATSTINEFSSATAILMALILAIVAFGTYAFTRTRKAKK